LNNLLPWLKKALVVLLVMAFPVGIAHAYMGAPDGICRIPEFDPNQLVSGVALLIGGAVILLERRRARRR
jgi:hypothetical protein